MFSILNDDLSLLLFNWISIFDIENLCFIDKYHLKFIEDLFTRNEKFFDNKWDETIKEEKCKAITENIMELITSEDCDGVTELKKTPFMFQIMRSPIFVMFVGVTTLDMGHSGYIPCPINEIDPDKNLKGRRNEIEFIEFFGSDKKRKRTPIPNKSRFSIRLKGIKLVENSMIHDTIYKIITTQYETDNHRFKIMATNTGNLYRRTLNVNMKQLYAKNVNQIKNKKFRITSQHTYM